MEGLTRIQKNLQLNIIKNQSNFKKTPKARLTKAYVEVRLDNLEKYWSKFEDNHYKLLQMKEISEDCEYLATNTYDQVEEKFLEFKCELKESLSCFTNTTTPTTIEKRTESSTAVKLPKIELPNFSGKYMEWPTFHDLFESLIHKNDTLADVQKLHYLKSHLTGEAEQLLRHIPITEANYAQCWAQMKKRYSNKRYIATNILNRLFGQKILTAESSNGIKQLLDTTNECLNALINLELDVSSWDIIIIYIVTQKLDNESKKQWEQKISDNIEDLPTLKEFNQFLESRFRALEFLEPKDRRSNTDQRQKAKVFSVTTVLCPYCKESHLLHQCKRFCVQDFNTRHEFVQNNRLCYNCFGFNHTVTKCKRNTSCRRCHRRHHSLLHPENEPSPSQSLNSQTQIINKNNLNSDEGQSSVNHNIATHFANNSVALPGQVMLATALVKVESKRACSILRALLDQGSQASFITEKAVQLLGLRKIPVEGIVSGLGGDHLNLSVKHMVLFEIQSTCSEFSCNIQAYVLNCLSSTLPTHSIEIGNWPEFSGLTLADPYCGNPGEIDLLLGADLYGLILTNGLIRNPSNTLTAQNTLLGWIISGRVQIKSHCAQSILSMHIQDHSVNDLLRKFWELETDYPQEVASQEDKICEEFFVSTSTRDSTGRYVVSLPFRDQVPDCRAGEFRTIALKRFNLLEKRLDKNPQLKQEYSNVIKEYLDLNHMEVIQETDPIHQKDSVYLPHHAVVRAEKTTSKVRVVFDASSKGAHGKSLNDYLLVGPRLQPELRHIIMNWRTYPICFVADIIKMYRQVKITSRDTNYQRILWRENSSQEVSDYRLLRVTFGVSSAPYLAVRSLQQVAQDEGEEYPLAKDRVLKHFYMDDFMSGCESEEEALEIYWQVVEMLKKGGFELQKWKSNSPKLMREFNERIEDKENLEIKTDEVVKILGLTWNFNFDSFEYKVQLTELKKPITKRVILSDISRLFDPLGWVSPVIVKAKIYMQKLWLAGVSWDQEVSSDLLKEWVEFREELHMLNEFVIPRWVYTRNHSSVDVHGFCDASNDAYAATVYLRVTDEYGNVDVNLLAARTKVSPLKQVSVPRLELCGALLLAKLLSEISSVLSIPKTQLHAWTDSTIVLAWLRGEPRRWKTFVANRVTEILKVLDNDQWSHVESSQNPADCASRGLSPKDFLQHSFWLKGPQWLSEPELNIPESVSTTTSLEERIIAHAAFCDSYSELPVWSKFSSFQKLLRVIAYCCRFIRKLKSKTTIFPAYITVEELDASLKLSVQSCQRFSFPDELDRLSKSKSVAKSSCLGSLCPFLDKDGIMRVRGRLQQSQETYDIKHPIILPHSHHLSTLIVANAHAKTLHGGPQLMFNYIRSKFWIIRVKSLIKQYCRKCVKCIRYSKSNTHPFMGELPRARVSACRAFLRSGVDYAGPISVRLSKGRGCKCNKGYICVFVCMATRAIHLEAVSDLTSEGFLAAFERFVGRRGHCQEIWSDNGSNFIGASKELVKLFKEEKDSMLKEVAENLANRGTEWHFIPPHAPNFGGLWEAGVKSTKYHLKRVLDGSTLTFEELTTLLVKIEACLNSRPMYKTSDGDDNTALTPGHFLICEPLVSVPSRKLEDAKGYSLSRWQMMQKMVQQFWRKWSREYLTTLQSRYKWTKHTPEPDVGDLVLVREDDLPPTKWLLGIVAKKHPGPDNVTRVVTLKCKNNEIKRPVSKLLILPVLPE